MKFVLGKVRSIRERCRHRLMILHLQLLRVVYGQRPVPLSYWLAIRSVVRGFFRSPDPLFPPYASLQSTGAALRLPELQQLLWNDMLGTWTIDRTTIELFWGKLQRDRPAVVIECGAGASSLILAKYAARFCSGPRGSWSVLSLEQDPQVKQTIERRLAQHGLSEHVKILHTPISESGRYQLNPEELWEQLGTSKADWLLIDGPAGPEGCRVWTLTLLAKFCRPGARWFLDDALRDGELGILREWCHVPGVSVEGIYPTGKGLGTGLIEDPQQVAAR